jgi:hypothetical protein
MKNLILILLIPIAFSFHEAISQNAPITTIGAVETYGTTTVVPITVTGFTNIGGCDLLLHYDPAVATATSVSLGPGVGAYYFIGNVLTPGQISVSWLFFSSGAQGLTLPDNSVFLNITFDRTNYGYSAIEFDISHPLYCEFYDWEYEQLNDTPNSTYYIDGSITFAVGTHWTGNIDADWSNALNWDAGVPGAAIIAIINDVSPNPFPLSSTNAECLGLYVSSGASLTVPANSALTVLGNCNNNGQLTIKSTSAGDGSFINYGAITGSGIATVERYLTSEVWHYVSSPISDGLSAVFLDIYLIEWNEITGDWSFIVPVNYGLNPMEGYGVWADDDFTGTTTVFYETVSTNLNSGTFVSPLLTASGPYDPSVGTRGFNFVGNPYPSAVDWDEVTGWEKSTLANAIYIWNPSFGQYGSYVNGFSTNDVTNIVPGGQGFFVHNYNDFTTTTLEVNNNARVHNNKPFFKGIETEKQSMKLSITSEINMYSDELIVSFNESATPDFDPSYDALNLKGHEEAPDIYSRSTDDKNLSINAYAVLEENVVIPVSCKIGINGFYTITATDIVNFDASTHILLEDIFENTFIDLAYQNSYVFFASATDIAERFNLHFLLDPVNTTEIEYDLNIQIFAANNAIHVKRQDLKVLEGSLTLYDVLGRLISTSDLAGITHHSMPIDKQGVFIVNYFDHAEQKAYRQKVYLQ